MRLNMDYRSDVSALVLCAVLLCSSAVLATGQGLDTTDGATQGAAVAAKTLEQLYKKSNAWKTAWRTSRAVACSSAGISEANLCTASINDQQRQALELATSPAHYDSRNTTYTGVPIISTPKDQGSCSTCVAFVVTAALETALAAAIQEPVNGIDFSEQQLFFCSETGSAVTRSCSSPWAIKSALDAVDQLQKEGKFLSTEHCMPYSTDIYSGDRCAARCDDTDPRVKEGIFRFMSLGSAPDMMAHIRQHGAVITAMNEMDDMRKWFAKNPKGVYTDHKGAQRISGHAVLLVGYDLPGRYWIAKNSWGTKFADRGFFKVAFGAAGIGSIDYSWGVWFDPYKKPMSNMQLQKLPVPGSDDCHVYPGNIEGYTIAWKCICYSYTAKAGDYLSGLATKLGISIQTLLSINIGVIGSVDDAIIGKKFKFCLTDLPPSQLEALGLGGQEQLKALLQIKQWQGDAGCRLDSWNEDGGQRLGFCIKGRFDGITCNSEGYVIRIDLRGLDGCRIFRGKDLAGLPRLQEVALQQATGVLDDDYGLLTELINLTIVHGSMKGTIPASLAKLPGVEVMDFSDNMLTGTLPPDLGHLQQAGSNLKLLVTNNRLSGPLPGSWSKLYSLVVLALGNNSFTGTIPPGWFARMRNLEGLDLSNNRLSGPIPSSIGKLPDLVYADLYHNTLIGTLPVELGQLSNLVTLDLGENHLKGPLPKSLAELTHLSNLYINDNMLTGPLDPSWGVTMQNLSVLWLQNNKMTGTLPGMWLNLPLTDIQLYGNKFSGMLPSAWSNMPLKWLDLSGNRLQGPLPPSYAALGPSLTALKLNNNQLTSTLPPAYSEWKRVKELDLSHNNITGSLLASWGGMAALKMLSIQNNHLSGTLPSEWGAFSNLNNMTLSNNFLEGPIPASWGLLPKLQRLFLGGNRLQGTLPTYWRSLATHYSKLTVQLWGNKGLVGCLPAAWNMTTVIVDPKGSVHAVAAVPHRAGSLNDGVAIALVGTGIEGMCRAR